MTGRKVKQHIRVSTWCKKKSQCTWQVRPGTRWLLPSAKKVDFLCAKYTASYRSCHGAALWSTLSMWWTVWQQKLQEEIGCYSRPMHLHRDHSIPDWFFQRKTAICTAQSVRRDDLDKLALHRGWSQPEWNHETQTDNTANSETTVPMIGGYVLIGCDNGKLPLRGPHGNVRWYGKIPRCCASTTKYRHKILLDNKLPSTAARAFWAWFGMR
jgi:hypothetical protein